MRTLVSLAMSATMIGMIAVTPAAAGSYNGCQTCIPTIIRTVFGSAHPGTPDPTRRGLFISHFDSNGVPQSLITQAETYIVETEVPCPPKTHDWSWDD